MKNLNEYINRKFYKLPNYTGYCTFEEYCDINNLIEDNLTQFQIDYYYLNIYSDFHERSLKGHIFAINESLKSHSKDKIIHRLYNILDDNYNVYSENDINNPGIVTIETNYINDLVSKNSLKTLELLKTDISKEVYYIIDFFRYHISFIELKYNKYYIYLEPAFTRDCTDDVKKNGNIVYHITKKENVTNILKKGLRPKVGKTPMQNGYRYFPERLFVINNSKNIKHDLDNVILDKELKNYVILKIDLKNHNIGFFVDDASNNKNFMYTLNAIPPQLIEVIDINDL